MNHLSESDIFLYCDKEMSTDYLAKVSEHLDKCEECRNLLEEIKDFSGKLSKSLPQKLPIEQQADCLKDIQIFKYLEGCESTDNREIIEKHLSRCGYCLIILGETKKFFQKEIKEDVNNQLVENIIILVKKALVKKKV